MAVPNIRKTTDVSNAGLRTFGWEVYDEENTSVVLQSGSESHVASMLPNTLVSCLLKDLLAEYLKTIGFSEPPSVLPKRYVFVGTLAADQSTGANTTPISLTGLVFNYLANSKYRIWFMGRIQAAVTTTGCGFQFDLSSTVTSIDIIFHHQLANTGTLTGGHSAADDASVGLSSGVTASNVPLPFNGQGLLITGANAGTAQLRFRSEVSAVITAKAGITLAIEKIS